MGWREERERGILERGESLSADSGEGNIGGEEHRPKRTSESFLWTKAPVLPV